MAATIPSKRLLKKLNEADIRVRRPSGVSFRVTPVKKLKGSIERYLPPAGQYNDEGTVEDTFSAIDLAGICVLCWNTKTQGHECECTEKCTLCGTKQHRGRDCPKIYASIEWWRSHGHCLRRKAHIRPRAGERAYLVVAGVFKEWKRLKDPVVVNPEHPVVKAFYKGKDTPCALTELPRKLRLTSTVTTVDSSTGSGAEEASLTTVISVAFGSAHARAFVEASTGERDSPRDTDTSAVSTEETNDVDDKSHTLPFSPEEDDSFLGDLLEDTWQPSTYHEGTRYATVTPLSVRLAIATAQHFSTSQQATTSAGNDVRADLDPRLRTRTPQQDALGGHQSLSECNITHGHIKGAGQVHSAEQNCGECHNELQKSREEMRAKDRRIRELELALHESEGWTDAVTYRGGQKRPRL